MAGINGSGKTKMGPEDAILLTADLAVRSSLSNINLYSNRIGSEGAKVLAPAIRDSPSLLSINLSSNNLGDAETGYVKASNVQGSSFGVGDKVFYQGREMIVSKGKDKDGDIKMKPAVPDLSGITAIADAMRVSHSLTAADLQYNKLNDDSKQLVRESVKDRVGFDLKL